MNRILISNERFDVTNRDRFHSRCTAWTDAFRECESNIKMKATREPNAAIVGTCAPRLPLVSRSYQNFR